MRADWLPVVVVLGSLRSAATEKTQMSIRRTFRVAANKADQVVVDETRRDATRRYETRRDEEEVQVAGMQILACYDLMLIQSHAGQPGRGRESLKWSSL